MRKIWRYTFLLLLGGVTWVGLSTLALSVGHACDGGLLCFSLVSELPPIIVGVGFLIASFFTFYIAQEGVDAYFFLLIASILFSGQPTSLTPESEDQFTYLFYFQLALLPPLLYYFHERLTRRTTPPAWSRGVRYLLAIGAAIWLSLLLGALFIDQRLFLSARLGSRLFLILGFLCVVGLLAHRYVATPYRKIRRRIRLVSFGTLLAFAPLLFLSLLPDTLGLPTIPYAGSFMLTLLSPLMYLYVSSDHAPLRIHALFRRGLTLYILLILFLTLYWLAMLASRAGVPWLEGEFTTFLLFSLMGVLVGRMYAPSQRFVRWLIDGGEIEYQRLADQFTAAFALVPKRSTVETYLLEKLPEELRVLGTHLYVKGGAKAELVPVNNRTSDRSPDLPTLSPSGPLAQYLATSPRAVHIEALQRRFADSAALSQAERQLLELPHTTYWLPFAAQGTLHGLLLVGERRHEDIFTSADHDFFQLIIHQMGIALHNLSLLEEVRASQAALDLSHRHLQLGIEQERLRMAQDLHDGPLQELLGEAFRFGHLARQLPAAINQPLLEGRVALLNIVTQLRHLLREVRPPGLHDLGLEAALHDYIASLGEGPPGERPSIYLSVAPGLPSLPESVEISLFRIIQEAVRNALTHAEAGQLSVVVRLHAGGVLTLIKDDGKGFAVPHNLSALVHQGHFGLKGMADRSAWAGGKLELFSHPGEGTIVKVWVPLSECNEEAS